MVLESGLCSQSWPNAGLRKRSRKPGWNNVRTRCRYLRHATTLRQVPQNAPQSPLWAKCGYPAVTSLFLKLSWRPSWIWGRRKANLEHYNYTTYIHAPGDLKVDNFFFMVTATSKPKTWNVETESQKPESGIHNPNRNNSLQQCSVKK